ncbi:hypothetical protein BOTCAL_0709g00010 [Botryotinia calthae]|uniref:Ecp2 effector protein domain-containing protein n=1 Tax=Botryotinia calthae TaxID=38488 RepID=A0A4Y8CIP2_9HELO|nr:hypothetical protein BOTCAL_0709g00010 [Botryotinia calthae]
MYHASCILLPLLLLLATAVNGHRIVPRTSDRCRSTPGDASWPSPADWAALNKTVGGRLLAPIPIGAPCHMSFSPFTGTKIPTRRMQCLTKLAILGWLEPDVPCIIGDHDVYAINATGPSDIQPGLDL